MEWSQQAYDEAQLDELLDDWHEAGLPVYKYSRMLRLAKRVGKRHGLTLEEVLSA